MKKMKHGPVIDSIDAFRLWLMTLPCDAVVGDGEACALKRFLSSQGASNPAVSRLSWRSDEVPRRRLPGWASVFVRLHDLHRIRHPLSVRRTTVVAAAALDILSSKEITNAL